MAGKRRGRPPKNAPAAPSPPPKPEEAEGTELEDAADIEPVDDAYVNGILSSEQSARRQRRMPRERADVDEHDLPDKPPPGWLE